ncbi:MAG TPA: carboxypeptidase regulatory-like domain-containing protein [bacterium]|nr:carboxypeptidase regulatory-like domain-containing protein [bacterium]HQI47950.1 carboxypeptidase regulatory-like domain-containing protein [bacterium]HQJ64627.1 carboxypeptidase regulatory-like domain-containing protein [bacterium]
MKPIHYLPVLPFLTLACTKTVEKIVYPESNANSDKGTIVGLVKQTDSRAHVIVRQAVAVDTVQIDPATGEFRIENLTPGNYDLSIKAAGYGTTWMRGVIINRGTVSWVGEITLARVPLEFPLTFSFRTVQSANTKYTVTISADAADLYGTTMPAPYSFVFITEPE